MSFRFGRVRRKNIIIILLSVALTCSFLIGGKSSVHTKKRRNFEINNEKIEVVCVCANHLPLMGLLSLIGSIIDESRDIKINLNILAMEKDFTVYTRSLMILIEKMPNDRGIELSYNLMSLDSLFTKFHSRIQEMKSVFCNPKCGYQDDHYYLRPFYHEFFPNYTQIVSLDVDLDFRIDIRELYEQFSHLQGTRSIAMASEQTPYYRNAFRKHRGLNKGTRIGQRAPKGFQGLNTGVMLFNLESLRKSKEYQFSLSKEGSLYLIKKYRMVLHLGDQDFFTLIGAEYPDFYYILDCSFNRQMDTIWRDVPGFEDYHLCDSEIRIYHGNGGSLIPEAEG